MMHGHTCIYHTLHISYVLYFIYDYDYDTLSYIGTGEGGKKEKEKIP